MATASSATFEVLCAFGVHRRRVTFASSTSGSNINAAKDAIKESFKDVLNDEEFFVQVFEKEGDWAGEFVDSGDTIPDHATLKIICSELSSEAGSSKDIAVKATSVCKRISTPPSSTNKSLLNKLFHGRSTLGIGSKRSFDPREECVVSKKKKTTKPKTISVCFLEEFRENSCIPRRSARTKLHDSGRFGKISVTRDMPADQVKEVLMELFSIKSTHLTYLKSVDNKLSINEEQHLSGDDVIKVAGQGSLYFFESGINVSLECPTDHNASDSDYNEFCTTESETLIPEPEGYIEVSESIDVSENIEVSESIEENEKEEIKTWEEREANKVQLTSERIKRMKEEFSELYRLKDGDGIKVAFQWNEHSRQRIVHNFSSTSTVKDMYRFVLTKDASPVPFVLISCSALPKIQLDFSLKSLTDCDVHGSLLIVQKDLKIDVDCFLNLLDNEDEMESSLPLSSLVDLQKGREFLLSIGATPGVVHEINRKNVYCEALKLYSDIHNVSMEFPLQIQFKHERGVDLGGLTRDFFSAFWAEAFIKLFEGDSTVIPSFHPHTQLSLFETLGKIISHGYLVCGYLPIKIAMPTLMSILFGPKVDIPSPLLLDSLKDHIEPYERSELQQYFASDAPATSHVILGFLSRFGCRQLPTRSNLSGILIDLAKYQFIQKIEAAISAAHRGIPDSHKAFWQDMGVEGIVNAYRSLSMNNKKILSILCCNCRSSAEEQVFLFLKVYIAHLKPEPLQNFIRYITGSSVLTIDLLLVIFNSSEGFMRAPCAHTCSGMLELPISYASYSDFCSEWDSILNDTNGQWKWEMQAY